METRPSGPSPRELVAELDRFIVGQDRAKRAIAVAFRNRERRRLLPPEVSKEIMPKNIMLIGPTGVGKTELARRVASLVDAPFVKVEATKFTEAGYVGRDVESIIHDLAEIAINHEHDRRLKAVESRAQQLARERLANYLIRQRRVTRALKEKAAVTVAAQDEQASREARRRRQHDLISDLLARDQLDDQLVEIEVPSFDDGYGLFEFSPGAPVDELTEQFNDFVGQFRAHRTGKPKTRQVSVREARRILEREEANRLVEVDDLVDRALDAVEENGVVFIDEIDKLIGGRPEGGDVSGEGVQRDLLPIVEGSTVMTRYGPVQTDHILFVSAGSFYRNRPSELIPELQGRFPIRVDLDALTRADLLRILTETATALPGQYSQLLETESVRVEFTGDGLDEVARIAAELNERIENIGARRLEMVMERVMEDISFRATELQDQTFVIDREYVATRLADVRRDQDLGKYIL